MSTDTRGPETRAWVTHVYQDERVKYGRKNHQSVYCQFEMCIHTTVDLPTRKFPQSTPFFIQGSLRHEHPTVSEYHSTNDTDQIAVVTARRLHGPQHCTPSMQQGGPRHCRLEVRPCEGDTVCTIEAARCSDQQEDQLTSSGSMSRAHVFTARVQGVCKQSGEAPQCLAQALYRPICPRIARRRERG